MSVFVFFSPFSGNQTWLKSLLMNIIQLQKHDPVLIFQFIWLIKEIFNEKLWASADAAYQHVGSNRHFHHKDSVVDENIVFNQCPPAIADSLHSCILISGKIKDAELTRRWDHYSRRRWEAPPRSLCWQTTTKLHQTGVWIILENQRCSSWSPWKPQAAGINTWKQWSSTRPFTPVVSLEGTGGSTQRLNDSTIQWFTESMWWNDDEEVHSQTPGFLGWMEDSRRGV